MKGWQKLLARAGVVSGISTISLLIKEGFPPTYKTGYFAFLTFMLGILVFIRTAWDNDDEDGDGVPHEPRLTGLREASFVRQCSTESP